MRKANGCSIGTREAGPMPKQPPPAFVAIREALLRMGDAHRIYVVRWLKRWLDQRGALRPSLHRAATRLVAAVSMHARQIPR